MRSRSTICATALVLTTCLTLSACGSDSSSTTAGSGAASDTVTVATTLALASLDPTVSTDSEINDILFDPLVRIDAAGKVTPDLATSWTTSRSGAVWTFTLRPDVKFQDGSPVTAADVVWTYQKIMADKASPQYSNVKSIKSVAASGADEVVFELAAPNVGFLQPATRVEIVPSKIYQKLGGTGFAAAPVGSGPYQLVSLQAGSQMTIRAYPGYWEGAAKVKNVVFESIADETTRINGLRGGSIDAAQITAQGASTVAGSGLRVKTVASDKVTFLGYDVRSGPLADVPLRQAISYAIDRPSITKGIFAGAATPVGQLIAPTAYGYAPDIPVPQFDLATAKKLVSESGYKGETITLNYPQGAYVAAVPQVTQSISSYLQAAGINVKLNGIEYGTFLTEWFGKKLAGMYLFAYAGLDAQAGFNLLNAAGTYDDSKVTTLFASQAADTNAATRLQTLAQISAQYTAQAYYAPLYFDSFNYVSSSRLTVPTRADGHIQPYDMTPG